MRMGIVDIVTHPGGGKDGHLYDQNILVVQEILEGRWRAKFVYHLVVR